MKTSNTYIKGRGSQLNPPNRFLKNSECKIYLDDLATDEEREELLTENPKTKYIEVFPKSILNKIDSPDLGLSWSMNPYQGCEHGCVYCYARGTHEYWGYSAGADFEQNILVKKSAPELLNKALISTRWEASPIMLSGNTDCYQPAERKLKITHDLLKVFLKFKHPVGIITKNSLIERDIDILSDLAMQKLVSVTLSLTALDEKLKRILEPRTSTAANVLRTIRKLTGAGIPVNVNVAPIIPAINDEGIFEVIEAVADAGALGAGYIVVRLNGHNGKIFEDWLSVNFPDRVNKVLNQIKTMHGGALNDSTFGRRMKGEGKFAELIKLQFNMAKRKFMSGRKMPVFDCSLYEGTRNELIRLEKEDKHQLKLF